MGGSVEVGGENDAEVSVIGLLYQKRWNGYFVKTGEEGIFIRSHFELPPVFWHNYYSRKLKNHIDGLYTSISKMTERLFKRVEIPVFGLH